MQAKIASKPAAGAVTPMMSQYLAVKEQYPDCLVFYRMGDFYELFFDDALTASAALDITLTQRGGKGDAEGIPMCGVPWHSHESYLSRLIRQGFKVAICEQVETPEQAKQRGGYKALVRRDVVRVVTQGTLTEDTLLEKSQNNYLVCVAETSGELGVAWLDLSTGDFTLQPSYPTDLGAVLARLEAGEILIPEKLAQNPVLFETLADYKKQLTLQPDSRFDSANARKRLEKIFNVGTLDSFGGFGRAEIAAAGALIDYVELTQKGKFPRLSPPRQLTLGSFMEIDAATRRNLEITHTLNGERKGSLLHAIDRTVTGAGARLLARYIAMPLTDVQEINKRLDMVAHFFEREKLRKDMREQLRLCADIERALARLSLERGNPRDLAAVRDTLKQAAILYQALTQSAPLPQCLEHAAHNLKTWGAHHPLIDQLTRALAEDLPALTREGGFIAKGYSPKLDELRMLRDESRQLIANLQSTYSKKTGVQGLKIKHNNVIGYFIEVTSTHADKLMTSAANKDGTFIHRQTLANNARFSTVELAELESKIAQAAGKALALEQELFTTLTAEVLAQAEAIAKTAQALAALDVAAGLADLAAEQSHIRPHIDDSKDFDIRAGRHLVVEAALKNKNAEFIANDCSLPDDQRLWLLTGPNMAGKSTFLRQNALIVLLAQAGCFVPAQSAKIGIVDRLFSRVGAADDLARGRSTFMVEMVETAAILNQATDRSLVILDEIGRGTATFDGLSIAWATLEYLHEKTRCRALFATHYHELTQLNETLPALSCHTMRVKEWQDSVIFMHEVATGSADRSYGIHVGRLAGLPAPVVARAEQVLKVLEHDKSNLKSSTQDLPLFSVQEPEAPKKSAVETLLEEIDPDALSPREALDALYKLKHARS